MSNVRSLMWQETWASNLVEIGTSNVLDPFFKVWRAFCKCGWNAQTHQSVQDSYIPLCISSSRSSGLFSNYRIHPTYYQEIHGKNFKVDPQTQSGQLVESSSLVHREGPSYSMNCWMKTDDEGTGWPMFYTGRKKVIRGGK